MIKSDQCVYKEENGFHKIIFPTKEILCGIFLDETLRIFMELHDSGHINEPECCDEYFDIQDYLEIYGLVECKGVEVSFVSFNRNKLSIPENVRDSRCCMRFRFGNGVPIILSSLKSILIEVCEDPEGEFTYLCQAKDGRIELIQNIN
jgi:hypothetical protein